MVNTQAISLSTFIQQQQVVPDLENSSPEIQLLYSATGQAKQMVTDQDIIQIESLLK